MDRNSSGRKNYNQIEGGRGFQDDDQPHGGPPADASGDEHPHRDSGDRAQGQAEGDRRHRPVPPPGHHGSGRPGRQRRQGPGPDAGDGPGDQEDAKSLCGKIL